jgi:hypothetical protein
VLPDPASARLCGGDVNLRDPQGCTPLHDAISNAEVAPQEQRHGESTQDDGEKGKYPAQELAAWLI